MSSALTRPDFKADIANLRRRIDALERRLTPRTATPPTVNRDIIFSYAGALVSDSESPPALIRFNSMLTVLAVALGTAGSANTILEVNRNGTVVATITVPSGATTHTGDVGVAFDPEDQISLRIDTAGTGVADMTAAARFS